MPKDEFDFEDPMELVSMPMPDDKEMKTNMALCLAEEFMRVGQSDEEILAMFRDPFYTVPNGVYLNLGEVGVKKAITEARANWIPGNL